MDRKPKKARPKDKGLKTGPSTSAIQKVTLSNDQSEHAGPSTSGIQQAIPPNAESKRAGLTETLSASNKFTELSSIDVDNNSSTVTIKVKITSKILKNVSTGSILEMDLCDGGSFCRCIAWNNLASFFNNKLSLNSTYEMSGISVRKIKPQFQKQGSLPIEIILSGGVKIKISDDDIQAPDTPYCTIDSLNQALSQRVNVIGIVKSYDNPTPQTTQQGKTVMKREIIIADDSNKETTATLWGEVATSFSLEGHPVVEITNSPVKSFKNKATISVTNIREDNTSPRSEKLKTWFKDNPCTTPVSTAKRRLDIGTYSKVPITQLSNIAVGEEVQVETQIENADCDIYVACKICKTAVITVLDEEYCPKCNKNTETTKRLVLCIGLKDFTENVKLFHDNMGCLTNIDVNEHDSNEILESIRPFHNKPGCFLILKRSKNGFLDYVILDITF